MKISRWLFYCVALLILAGTVGGFPNPDTRENAARNRPPEANAGPDATYYDTDGDGLEELLLDGSASRDDDGQITRYEWTLDGTVIGRGDSPVVSLWVGRYDITLTVTDNLGEKDSDRVTITVNGAACSVGNMTLEGVVDGQIVNGAVNIQAHVAGQQPGRVTFELTGPNGGTYTHTENNAPHYFLGDTQGIPNGWNTDIYPPGRYRLKVTTYQGNRPCEIQIVWLVIEEPPPPECAELTLENTIYGTNASETIHGTPQNDLIFAQNGSDTVYGKGGDDCIVGGNNSDNLYGEAGNDVLLGGNGSDYIAGGPGNDTIYGQAGSNWALIGNSGDDTIYGGPGHDNLYGDEHRRGANTAIPGRDKLYGENGHDELFGGPNNDLLQGGNGSDNLHGNDGDDMLAGNRGSDAFFGDAGTDAALDYTDPPDYLCRRIESGCAGTPTQIPPVANDDGPYVTIIGGSLILLNANSEGLLENDSLGMPAAALTTFGGGDAGGSVTDHRAGDTIPLAGGTLTVDANGDLFFYSATALGTYTFQYRLQNAAGFDDATVTIIVGTWPDAVDDYYSLTTEEAFFVPAPGVLSNDDLGFPAAVVISFGGGDLSERGWDYAAGTTVNFAGGTITLNADGSLQVSNLTTPGYFSFEYYLDNGTGGHKGIIYLEVFQKPDAQDYTFTIPVNETLLGDLLVNASGGATLFSGLKGDLKYIGGGDLGGSVTTYPTPNIFSLAGGTLTVHRNGTFQLVNPTVPGTYTFQYRLETRPTLSGSFYDDATVTIEVVETYVPEAPDAVDDHFVEQVRFGSNFHVFANDDRGMPPAVVVSYGGGDLGGSVTDRVAGSWAVMPNNILVRLDAYGVLTVHETTPAGLYTFQYRLQNAAGFDDATITLEVQKLPDAKDDSFVMTVNGTLTGDLTADNGHGADVIRNEFPYISFGGGDLPMGPHFTLPYQAPNTVAFAGGTLTVHRDGTFELVNPTSAGTFYFLYSPGRDTAVVTIEIQGDPVVNPPAENPQPPDAQDDHLVIESYDMDTALGLTNNDNLGSPEAQVVQFGGGVFGSATYTVPASVPFAGGTLIVTNFAGVDHFWLQNPTMFGTFTFQYRLQNEAGFDDATVTLELTGRDLLEARGDEYYMEVNTIFFDPMPGVLGDDDSQPPYPALVSFGGGDLGGTPASYLTGTAVPFAGGTLILYADGSLFVHKPTITGFYVFQYRVQSSLGFRDGNVLIIVNEPF